jgi:bifunctional non-homologous end joining protein LigD
MTRRTNGRQRRSGAEGADSLRAYREKRDFEKTPEPAPGISTAHRRPIFVIQEHHASHLHYDLRLEADGVLKSWAVPKEPSLDPAQKRLAVHVEDHPLSYDGFQGTISAGQYGAGEVRVWDRGTYEPVPPGRDVAEALDAGKLEFALHGERLRGRFSLVRMRGKGRGKESWLLMKGKDEHAQPTAAHSSDAEAAKANGARGRHKGPATPRAVVAGTPPDGLTFTSTDKLMYPGAGITKGDVLDYYRRIAGRLLPYLVDRPVTVERLPDGLEGTHFWQKNLPASSPAWVARIELPSEEGKPVRYALVNDEPALLWLINQGVLTFHVWLSRVQDLDRPDFVLFDLDPGEATLADAVEVAGTLHGILEEEGTEAFVKTSGKTGLHVLTPWTRSGGHDEARGWALALAERVVAVLPRQATTERSKVKRGRRVYVDVMQNARGKHVVPPFVLRAVPGAPVSTPLAWRELTARLDPKRFTLKTLFRRLARQTQDPMAGLLDSARPAAVGSRRIK